MFHIVMQDAELDIHRRETERLMGLDLHLNQATELLAHVERMHSKAMKDLFQARRSIYILRKLVEEEPACVFCKFFNRDGHYIDSKCKRCSLFYHGICCPRSIRSCPQCQLTWPSKD